MQEREATGRPRGAASYPNGPEKRRRSAGPSAWLAGPLLALAAGPVLEGCQTVPVTGRTQFNAFSVADDVQLGQEAYAQVLAEGTPVTSGPELAMVERIMQRIVAVSDDPGFDWEVTLLKDDSTVNAFALPGGKMAVYTGILPVTQTEAGLAVVMGHEIAHVIARHGTERVTRSLGFEVALALLDVGDYEGLARTASAILFDLPFSRSHESEADHIGLRYMARAGYDPREAVTFWQRMSQMSGNGPPEFLSTHPSHETRIKDLEGWMPEALAEFRGN